MWKAQAASDVAQHWAPPCLCLCWAPRCALPARAALSLQTHRQWAIAAFPRQALKLDGIAPPSWGISTGGGTAIRVFLQGCYCCLPCSGRSQLFAVINICLCCIWKRGPRIDTFNPPIPKGWAENETRVFKILSLVCDFTYNWDERHSKLHSSLTTLEHTDWYSWNL